MVSKCNYRNRNNAVDMM